MNDSRSIAETIFIGARDLSHPRERAVYLDQACGNDPALRERVERMLNAEQKADQFLAHNPLEFDASLLASTGGSENVGTMIGPYKLLQQIGEGGCGIVYMAEQEQPIRRRVALKVIKPGMDTRQVIARFEAERQALAMMDHPNIARVIDAGSTEAGRPYFVMELVRGVRITEYCDQNNLSTHERLDLFTKVVQAVQHAHQKGIIHRDLKPSNVLITLHDGVPVPKVIDFGIAKALEQKLTDKTLFTQFEQFIGTPAYTSPEQAEMSGLDIDTRSDIYSLGVLLYELLVGKTPFDAQELVHSGLDEMRRIIREKEPDRPSTRLSTMLAEERTTTAQHRAASSPELIHLLKGDLDWIVMKCLEKDRTRRYDNATGLAADIEHYLGNEPVSARPPSQVYRFSKLVRRNKLAFAAGTTVALTLVVGIIVSTWQATRARHAERAAKKERDSAEAVLQFVRDKILAASRPEGQKGGLGKDLTLRQAIDAAEAEIGKSFSNRPLVEASIRKTLGESYRYLGEPTLAVQQLERAFHLRRQELGLIHGSTFSVLVELQKAYGNRKTGMPEQSLVFYEEYLRLTKAKHGPAHPNTLTAMHELAGVYSNAKKHDQALTLLEETLKLKKATLKPNDDRTLSTMNNLAVEYLYLEKPEQAVPLFEELFKVRKAKLGADHSDTLITMANLAGAYGAVGKHDQSLALTQESVEITKAKLGPEHPDTLEEMHKLGGVYSRLGRHEQAIPLYEETLKLRKAKLGQEHPKTLRSMNELGYTYRRVGKQEQAVSLYEESLKLRKAKLGQEHPDTLRAMNNLGFAYSEAGKHDQALTLLEETLKLMKARLGADHRETLNTMGNLSRAYCSAGKHDQEVAPAQEKFDLSKAKLGPEHPDTLMAGFNLAVAFQGVKNYDQSLLLLEETFQIRKAKFGPEHRDTLDTMYNLAIATEYATSGSLDKALPLYEEALRLMKATDHPDTLGAMNYIGDAYRAAGKLDQAEALFRESLGRKTDDGTATLGLARVLSEQARTDSTPSARSRERVAESFQLARDGLAKLRIRYTNDPVKLEGSLGNGAEIFYRHDRYVEAEPLYREILQSRRARLRAEHKDVMSTTASLARLLADWAWTERTEVGRAVLSAPGQANDTVGAVRTPRPTSQLPHERAREAERLLRECLAAHLSGTNATPWRVADVRSRLGGALVSVAVIDRALDAAAREAKFAEAETLLLEGNQRLQESDKKYKRDALERLTRLYEAWGKPGERAEWQQKLEAFEKGHASGPGEAKQSQ